MPKKRIAIKHILEKLYYWIEDKKLFYHTVNDYQKSILLSEDEFAFWEMGFREGHARGIEYAEDQLNKVKKPDLKRLREIYG